jgi:hypothetical protein
MSWANQFGGTDSDDSRGLAINSTGEIYVTGHYIGTCDFDPGAGVANQVSAGGQDIFLTKLDNNGNLILSISMGGADDDQAIDIAVGPNDNIYLTGFFRGTADFDPTVGTTNLVADGGKDHFVASYDTNGALLWANQLSGSDDEQGSGITVTSSGVYSAGRVKGTVSFDPASAAGDLTSTGNNDISISKYDFTGNFIWAKIIGNTGGDYAQRIASDENDNVYVTGVFKNTVDFDPGAGVLDLTSFGNNDVFALKLDTNGDLIWAKSMGGTGNDIGHSIQADAAGQVYLTGFFEATADFDPNAGTTNLTSEGLRDVFVQKLDQNGDLLWAKAYGSSAADDQGKSINVDVDGSVYVSGFFEGTVDFDPNVGVETITSNGDADIFIQQLDSLGNHIFTHNLGGTGKEGMNKIVVDADKNLFFAGKYTNTMDCDPNTNVTDLTAFGSDDAYIVKWSFISSVNNDALCFGDSLVINGTTYNASNLNGTELFTNVGANNIDSTVVIDISVLPAIDVSVTYNAPQSSFTADLSGASYQWLDCDNGNAILSGETNQVFIPTVIGNYAVEITEGGCVDTSACENISNVGIDELNYSKLEVYPNPTNGQLTIGNLSGNAKSIVLVDLQGREVKTFTGNTSVLNVSNVKNGVYFLKLETNTSMETIRILKK